MRILPLPIAFIEHIVLKIRHKLYDWHIMKSIRFDMPVICVGNLNLGGTGKTPTVEYLIQLLKDKYNVATLSRGYGRKTNGFQLADNKSTYETIGDEPLQYFHKFNDIQVAVDEDRIEGVENLLKNGNPPEVILLDDAFQHRKIKAGLNILLTEYQHLYCDDFLFPAGTLRDIKSAAKRADIIVVSKSPNALDADEKQRIIKKLKPDEHQKVFFSTLEYASLRPLNESAKQVSTKNVDSAMAFCGIANHKPFIEAMEKHYKTFDFLYFPDHHAYTGNDVKNIHQRYADLGGEKKIIVTTEKDAARLTNSPYLCEFETAPLYVLPVGVRFHEEEKFNEEILNYVREDMHYN
ncbi:MAG: tetraacyldisaccharide 4'-kinase [Bacteroidales bacterium]|nr:tetraacyldisaccharide 4'-kinase [Bacteroidales bacterium]